LGGRFTTPLAGGVLENRQRKDGLVLSLREFSDEPAVKVRVAFMHANGKPVCFCHSIMMIKKRDGMDA